MKTTTAIGYATLKLPGVNITGTSSDLIEVGEAIKANELRKLGKYQLMLNPSCPIDTNGARCFNLVSAVPSVHIPIDEKRDFERDLVDEYGDQCW